MYLYHNTYLKDLITRLDDSLILDFNCMARIKALVPVVADSGQPARQEKALGSRSATNQRGMVPASSASCRSFRDHPNLPAQ